MADPDEGFLRRWSRRKREQGDAAPEAAADERAPAAAAHQPEPPDEQAIAAADLPDVDSLDADSDYSTFMHEGVPEALRNQALRKLWTSNPVLANLDGLNDYDEDFALLHEVGKAAMQKLAEAARKAADDAKAGTEQSVEEEAESGDPSAGADAEPEASTAAPATEAVPDEDDEPPATT